MRIAMVFNDLKENEIGLIKNGVSFFGEAGYVLDPIRYDDKDKRLYCFLSKESEKDLEFVFLMTEKEKNNMELPPQANKSSGGKTLRNNKSEKSRQPSEFQDNLFTEVIQEELNGEEEEDEEDCMCDECRRERYGDDNIGYAEEDETLEKDYSEMINDLKTYKKISTPNERLYLIINRILNYLEDKDLSNIVKPMIENFDSNNTIVKKNIRKKTIEEKKKDKET